MGALWTGAKPWPAQAMTCCDTHLPREVTVVELCVIVCVTSVAQRGAAHCEQSRRPTSATFGGGHVCSSTSRGQVSASWKSTRPPGGWRAWGNR